MASEFVRKDAHARALLGMFCFALALEATIRPAVGAGAGDPRTYIEMTAGIVKTGLPYIENGPLTLIDRFPGLQMPWDVVTDGRAWGIYGPVYPYLAAPFLWYGGLRLMSIFTALMLIPVALASFLLARLVTRDELLGAYAGILTVVSTPLLSKAFEPSPYLLGTALIAGATYAAIRSTRAVGRSRTLFGALAGLLGGLTWGSHMLLAPMAVALWPAVAFVDSPAGAPESRRSFAITRGGLMAALGFGAGLALCIGPLAWLNSVRFHSWSPLSYGPVPWPIVPHAPMTARDELLFALPCFAWLGVVGGAIWLGVTRPVLGPLPGLAQRIVAAALLAGALAVLAHEDELRERLIAMGNLGYAFVVDQAHTADPYLTRVSRFGALRGDRLNKSVLQATPILLMVLLLRPRDRREREAFIVLLAPCVALGLFLLMRANMGIEFGLGQPYVHLRYTLPMLPMAFAAVMAVLRDVRLARWHAAAAAFVGLAVARYLWATNFDQGRPTQLLVADAPIVVAVICLVVTGWYQRRGTGRGLARWAVIACLGLGIGIGYGHDYRIGRLLNIGLDMRAEAFAAIAPPRFAVFGGVGDLDAILTLRPDHDIEAADYLEWPDPLSVRPLLDRWFAEGRPVFFAAPGWPPVVSPWPDISFELLSGMHRYFRVVKH